jgi:hypothetical protein
VLYALSEATDEFANPPYVDKIGDSGRDALHCVCTTNDSGGEICKYLYRDFKAVYFLSE